MAQVFQNSGWRPGMSPTRVTCNNKLTGVRKLTEEQLVVSLAAIASHQRLGILAELAGGRLHVSELARRVGMSRALLYMHLTKLEEAGFVSGHLELGPDGKALKYFEVVKFRIVVDLPAVLAAVARTAASSPSSRTTTSAKNTPAKKGHS